MSSCRKEVTMENKKSKFLVVVSMLVVAFSFDLYSRFSFEKLLKLCMANIMNLFRLDLTWFEMWNV